MESLEREVESSDFAIAIAAPDDVLETRNLRWTVARDNVTFELGLFMGRLGRKRTILLESRDEHVHLPSDLVGLTTLRYVWRDGADATSSFAPTCNRIRDHVKSLGPRR